MKAGYEVHLTPQSALFVHAGPYVAYGIGGKEVTKERTFNTSGSDIPDRKTTSGTFGERSTATNGFSREDYGWTAGMGTSYRKLNLSVEYEAGLANIGNDGPDSQSDKRVYKNRNFSLVLGYNF